MIRHLWIFAIALCCITSGCSRSPSFAFSDGGSAELAARVAQAKNPNPAVTSEPCSTRTILPLTLVGSTYRGVYPINVVCTTGMIADLAREIGGSQVRITQLIGDGVDPHVYKPSPRDIGAL
ncbi:MAG TPA: zinc ABC transporter substrate-binding protein, partial [Pirellulales bacterium]